MQTEDIYIVHPANSEQASALRAFVKALKMKFEVTTEKAYNPDFVSKIEESKEQYKKGDYSVIKTEDLWK